MLQSLAHRGPDGAAAWQQGPVALGQQVMWITPESFHEPLPWYDATASCAIVADARLDNREELGAALRLSPMQLGALPDSQLILRAYQCWGEGCVEHLLGDFAFALWDGEAKQLVIGRDPMGIRPLHYAHDGQRFLFASEIRAILAVPGVRKELNRCKLACLALGDPSLVDPASSYFAGISYLPPATLMIVSGQGLRQRTYWQPDPSARLPLRSEAEALEAFRDLFQAAVGARLRSVFPVAALLSGGLDSSSVVAVAARSLQERGERLTTLSAILPADGESTVTDERAYIDIFRAQPNLDMRYITDPARGPFDNVERLVWGGEQPDFTSRHYLYSALADGGHAAGARVILEGVGGETGPTFHGDGYLAELLLKGHWLTLQSEIRRYRQVSNVSPWRTLLKQVLLPLLPLPALRLVRRAYRYDQAQWQQSQPLQQGFVEEQLGDEWPLLLRKQQMESRTFPDHRRNQARHIRAFQSWAGDAGFVGYERVRLAYPFMDRRILDFCLAAPGELKVHNGYRRYLIRAGLDGILPPAIQWRTSKEPFSPDYHRRYNAQRAAVQQQLDAIAPTDPIRAIVDVERLQKLARHAMAGNRGHTPGDFAAMHGVPSGIYLVHFLRQFDEFQP